MSDEGTTALKAARETDADLRARLDSLVDEWALAQRKLRIAELASGLEGERDAEKVKALEEELATLRVVLPDPKTVLKKGKVVEDIPWRDGESVEDVWIWCFWGDWTFLVTSSYQIGRVCGSPGGTWAKCYGGMFQLMRYQRTLYWVRFRPNVYIRSGGPGGLIRAILAGEFVRGGTNGAVEVTIDGNFIRSGGPGGVVIATIDEPYIRRGGPGGVVVATIDGSFIRSGGPGGHVKYTIDGEATGVEKGALAAAVMKLDGELGGQD